jgi:two-component system chemotaxis response regulator CheB
MNASKPLKVLVVDDTVVYRKIVSDVLKELPDVEVVGTAHNGKAALLKIKTLKPDLLTLDIEMPEVNGIEVLDQIRNSNIQVGAVMLSTLTQEGGAMTMRALELGAFDFIPKPQEGSMAKNKDAIKASLGPILRAFARNLSIKGMLSKTKTIGLKRTPKRRDYKRLKTIQGNASIIAIGISTGGPNALAQMLPKIPSDIGVPIVIVQHMPPLFTQSLAKSLDNKCAISVREAKNGEPLRPNVAYVAPGGKQMKIVAGADGRTRNIKITDAPPENSCKPSADYLFRSVADHFVGRATGVIMTGMGSDGTKGLKTMKNSGAVIIAQNEATCVVFGMPKEPIESGTADIVAPLDRIADEILNTVSYKNRKSSKSSSHRVERRVG